jgi:hypothetical protein
VWRLYGVAKGLVVWYIDLTDPPQQLLLAPHQVGQRRLLARELAPDAVHVLDDMQHEGARGGDEVPAEAVPLHVRGD